MSFQQQSTVRTRPFLPSSRAKRSQSPVLAVILSAAKDPDAFSGLKAFQKWGDIDAAFRSWAKNFRQRVDKAHAS